MNNKATISGKIKGSAIKGFGLFLLIAVLLSTLNAQEVIIVESDITQNTTWVTGNTYIIAADIQIRPGRTLTIESGVNVLFDDIRELLVSGTLIAQGSANDSILFSVNPDSPNPFPKWNGVKFATLSSNNLISYSIFENAVYAAIEVPFDSLSQIEIHHSSFRELQLGLKLDGSGVLVENCHFTNNVRGVNIRGNNNTIRGCTFMNHVYAIVIEHTATCRNNLVEENLLNNNIIGIEVGRESIQHNSIGSNTVRRNIIYNNKTTGMLIYQDSTVVYNNIFWANLQAITLHKARHTRITNNAFHENANDLRYIPVASVTSTNNTLSFNTITQTTDSIIVFRSAPQKEIRNNNIFLSQQMKPSVYNFTPQDIEVTENWWGSTDTDIINAALWDQNNNPALGLLNYEPLLSQPDTAAPVSPPANAVKRPVNNKLLISWDPNPESDIAGYKVYYGNFSDYSFSNMLDAGNSTFVYLQDYSLNDTVAVTAYDHYGSEAGSQLTGHESAFSFTRKAPYAGPDTAVCKNNGAYTIALAAVYDHDELVWKSSGDGSFDNPALLHPTYFPGDSDLETGSVVLTITVTAENDSQSHSFLLEFIPDPLAWAGNDTIIYPDTSLFLFEASAAYYETILWQSSGDGVFDNPNILNPSYTPGSNDKIFGMVQLYLVVESVCGVAIDSLSLGIEQYASVQGRVHAGPLPVTNGIVIAFLDLRHRFKAVKLAPVSDAGEFVFSELVKGDYYFYAVPDQNVYPGSLPAYYFSNLAWQDAHLISLTGNAYDLDLRLPSMPRGFPEGQGSISGVFHDPTPGLFEVEIYGRDWFNDPNSDPGDEGSSTQNLTVLLFSRNFDFTLGFTLTDEEGYFKFDDLPYGEYRVSVEKAGFIAVPSAVVTLSPEQPAREDLQISVDPKKIIVELSGANKKQLNYRTYPNPVAETLIIESGPKAEEIRKIDVFDSGMQHVYGVHNSPDMGNKDKKTSLNVLHFTPGFYVGIITTASQQEYYFTFIKK